jgi:D-hydroxyproline dehydrogenase subunit beta
VSGPADGTVWAHVGQTFAPSHYDLLIVGAGRMGAALAHTLRRLAPGSTLLLLEEGGLPNEEGASILAPGVWHAQAPGAQVPGAQQTRAERTRHLIGEALNVCSVLELAAEQESGYVPSADVLTPELAALIDPAELPYARLDARGGTYSVGGLTLANATAAVGLGADLMLNVRAELMGPELTGAGSNGIAHVRLHRLSVTNTHEVIVDHSVSVTAGRVIVAAGAVGPHLIESGLGQVSPHKVAYRQTPRLEVASSAASAVLSCGGLLLRPRDGGYTVVPPIPHPDPWGYVPTGGRLVGVPVGLRRETLDAVLKAMDGLSVLAGEGLVLGKSVADIPGAWLALPEGGWPLWERLDAAHWLLLGGERADLTGLAVAEELAQELARQLPGA